MIDLSTGPAHSCEVLVSQVNRAFVKQWICSYAEKRPGKCLSLIGPCGCGKSTLTILCLREMFYTVVVIHAGNYRSRKTLELRLKDASRLPLKQAILVEDPEMLAGDGGLQVLNQFSKQASRIPVVVICNRAKKAKLQPLLVASEVVVFHAMTSSLLSKHFQVSPDLCGGGDIRQICLGRTSGFVSHRDYHVDIADAASAILEGCTVDGKHLYRVDPQALCNIVHSNHTHLSKCIHTTSSVADDISTADLLVSNDIDADYSAIIGTVQPGQRLRKPVTKLQPDVVWTKFAFQLTRLRLFNSTKAIFKASGTSLTFDSLPLIRDYMVAAATANDWPAFDAWAPHATTQHLTSLLRTGFVKNDAVISRVRRHLKVRFKDDGVSFCGKTKELLPPP